VSEAFGPGGLVFWSLNLFNNPLKALVNSAILTREESRAAFPKVLLVVFSALRLKPANIRKVEGIGQQEIKNYQPKDFCFYLSLAVYNFTCCRRLSTGICPAGADNSRPLDFF